MNYFKKSSYMNKESKDAFLHKFLDDENFLKLYPKMNKNIKKEIREYRQKNGLEIIYNMVKLKKEQL